jgi:putative ABC transport system ATP-binding protein
MIIEVRNLCKEYVKSKRRLVVLNNFSYEFQAGKMYVLKGSSGVGKTTLLSMIGLLDEVTGGELLFDKNVVSNFNNKQKSLLRKNMIGFVFQDFNLMDSLTVEENISVPFLDTKLPDLDDKIKEMVAMMNLSKRMGHYPTELSGGEKQRVGIARALIRNPKVLLCDEPISNLDKENAAQIIDILCRVKETNDCIVIVSCHTSDFDNYADQIIEMKVEE